MTSAAEENSRDGATVPACGDGDSNGAAVPGRIDALPPLRAIIAAHALAARKNFGQNFLLDLNLTEKIVRQAGDLSGLNVVEIGPGPGGLTRALVKSAARCVTAVELDPRCVEALATLKEAAGEKLDIHAGDALAISLPDLVPRPRAIVANLPYNVATPLLLRWLAEASEYRLMVLMFQAEVAARLVAEPRSKAYGRLSVITQWLTLPKILFSLPPGAFTPQPKVTSSVVRFLPRAERADTVPFAVMERVTAAAFGQRRKMLRKSLQALGVDCERLAELAGIDLTLRAEDLSVADFVRLAEAYATSAASALR